MTVDEEFVVVVPITDTITGNDISKSLVRSLDRLEVDWSHPISTSTDGTPSIVRKKTDVVTKPSSEVFWNFHWILNYNLWNT